MRFYRRSLFWISALLLAACQTLPISESEKKLRYTLKVYEDVVRWGSLSKVYALTQPEPGVMVDVPAGLDNIRVTSYETVSGPDQLAEDQWTQTVSIEYVLTDRQIVKTLLDNQLWRLSVATGGWYRENPIPPFR